MPVGRQMKLTVPLSALVDTAVALLRANAPAGGAPYFGCFSGGKDSVVIKRLAELAGVPVQWHYNVIIDAPELMRFIRDVHPDVEWLYSRHGPFFRRIRQKLMVPTRWRRWCCREYKHVLGPKGCTRLLGIRCEESFSRLERYTQDVMPRPAGRLEVYPIRLWNMDHVWRFIDEQKIPYCSLYDEGFDRLGCVGCPLASSAHRRIEFARWPRYEKFWRAACEYVVSERERRGLTPPPRFSEGDAMRWSFDHWMTL